MAWFDAWWVSLTVLQQVLACVAIPATVVLIIQTILLLFGGLEHGFDHGEVDVGSAGDVDGGACGIDHDFGHDGAVDAHDVAYAGAHHAAGVRLFTVRGLVALFATGGWLGIAMIDCGLSAGAAVAIGAAGGVAMLLLVGWILALSLKCQEDGNIRLKNAVAQVGTVYLTVPPGRSGAGKITMSLQERFVELSAITDSGTAIPTGEAVQVVAVTDDQVVVRPLA